MRLRFAAGASLVLVVAMAGPARAEGLFDMLLGGAVPAASAPPEAGALTVHRRHARPRPTAPRVARASAAGHKPEIAIDPSKVADWYLRDPTLRRGDIVVLRSGVLVFTGHGAGAARRAADFARLRDARFLPARTRDFVAKATATNVYTAAAVAPPKPKPKPRPSAT